MGYLARAIALLALLPLLFVAGYWTLGPANLGLFTPDRSGNTARQTERPPMQAYVADPSVGPMQYLTSEACGGCHASRLDVWSVADHKTVICEACHGPGQAHVDSGASLAIEEPRELCERCHAVLASRPASHPQIAVEEHAGPRNCLACHDPHSPAIDAPAIPHTLEGRSECTACHGPTGFKPFPADHAGRTSDVCQLCHRQAQGAEALPKPPQVPHTLEGIPACTACHGAEGFRPYPLDHAGRPLEYCLLCHQRS